MNINNVIYYINRLKLELTDKDCGTLKVNLELERMLEKFKRMQATQDAAALRFIQVQNRGHNGYGFVVGI